MKLFERTLFWFSAVCFLTPTLLFLSFLLFPNDVAELLGRWGGGVAEAGGTARFLVMMGYVASLVLGAAAYAVRFFRQRRERGAGLGRRLADGRWVDSKGQREVVLISREGLVAVTVLMLLVGLIALGFWWASAV
jgi:hypothetical protein